MATTGTVSSLGIGSGTLTADVIDKLRANSEAQLVTPIDKKITLSQAKVKSFDLLHTLMSTFQTSVANLSNDTLFLNRSVAGSTSAVNVSASAGSDIQSFSISNVVTAQSDINQSVTFASKLTPIAPNAPAAGQLNLSVGGSSYAINYTSSTTLQDLATAINDTAGSKATASILQVGTNSYQLIVKSDSVGANQAITLSDSLNNGTDNANSLLTALGMSNIQSARDASFNYNGIPITRPTNDVTDLINGVTISLKQDQVAGTQANIDITQDKTQVSTEVSLLVKNYNALISNINDMTAYDKAAGKVGVFNGDGFIKSISREINNIMLSVDSSGKSLVDYGISVDKSGVMSFDSTAFDTKMNEDPTALQKFFSGSTTATTETNGIFDNLNIQMKSYTDYNKGLDTYNTNLNKTLTKLNTDRTTMMARLDDQYAIMTKRFSAYDAIISKINNQFASLKQMIAAQSSSTTG